MENVQDCSAHLTNLGSNQKLELCVPLQQLQDEHEPLLQKVQVIYDMALELKENGVFDQNWNNKYYQLYKHVVQFLGELNLHSYREDHFLYPILNRYLEDDSGMIMVMDYEHKNAKRSLKQFIETVENRKTPVSQIEAMSLLSCLEVTYLTVVEHFRKEEVAIFPLAEQNLTDKEKDTLHQALKDFG